MPEVQSHAPGTFCWIELTTTDAGSAKKFYGELLGWDSHDDPVGEGMVYTMFQRDGKNVGAGYEMGAEMRNFGVPTHWMPYVAVESADVTAARAQELGGQVVKEPFDVFDIGRMAVLKDPGGAHFSVWQAKKACGFQLFNEPNTFCWAELWTRDAPGAETFYTELFGWSAKQGGANAPGPYTEFALGEAPFAGMLTMKPEFGDAPPSWSIYFSVEDCDVFAARVKELGGNVIVPPSDIAGVGRFAVLQDPQGGVFSSVKLERGA